MHGMPCIAVFYKELFPMHMPWNCPFSMSLARPAAVGWARI